MVKQNAMGALRLAYTELRLYRDSWQNLNSADV